MDSSAELSASYRLYTISKLDSKKVLDTLVYSSLFGLILWERIYDCIVLLAS